MEQKQLEHLALQVRWQDGRTYRGKRLCRTCLMEKATISAPEDQMTFEHVWDHQWMEILERDRCAVCGELKETLMLPVNYENGTPPPMCERFSQPEAALLFTQVPQNNLE